MKESTLIEIRKVSKKYGDESVLRDVDLVIPTGSIFGIVGVSGAGKSTLLRCINGLETYEGSIVIDGEDLSHMNERALNDFRSNVGMIFQHYSLLERKTVEQNMEFALKCHHCEKPERKKRISTLLDLVGLKDKAKALPRELSGGQRQRVAIARALSLNPKILLCDEATSALDPSTALSIMDLLREINEKSSITIVLVTHQLSVVKEMCDQAAILEHGEMVYCGSTRELFSEHADKLASITGGRTYYDIHPDEEAFVITQGPDSDSVLPRLAIRTGAPFRVVWGGLDHYKDHVSGSFIIAVQKESAPAFQRELEGEPGVSWRTLGESEGACA